MNMLPTETVQFSFMSLIVQTTNILKTYIAYVTIHLICTCMINIISKKIQTLLTELRTGIHY